MSKNKKVKKINIKFINSDARFALKNNSNTIKMTEDVLCFPQNLHKNLFLDKESIENAFILMEINLFWGTGLSVVVTRVI